MTDSLDELAADYFTTYLGANPTGAHLLGHYEFAGSYEEVTRAAEDRQIAAFRDLGARAEAVDDASLTEEERITRAVILNDARTRSDMLEARFPEFAANPVFGPQAQLPLVLGMLVVPDAEVADAVVGKFEGIGRFFTDLAERQHAGVAAGRTSPEFAVTGTIEQVEALLTTPVADDPMVAAVKAPAGLDEQAWRDRLRAAVETSVRPGLAAYRDALRDAMLPVARPDDRCGLRWLEDGADHYDRTLRFYTTTEKTAEEIHEIGLRQVASLAEEYRELGPEVVGSEDLEQIFEAMRSDPALHFENADQLIRASEVAMARAWAAMPDWFETLPQAPCAVQPTQTGPKAFYFPPATDGSRGGTFFVNVSNPAAWGTFELESMAFHEGIPGHHLQLAIASELEGLPELRKHLHNAAYAEGWGLYTERLADEMGLYAGPADRMGMFAADSMRACRLVVDTGLHALGWTRQQAVDYMVDNSPMTEEICAPEIDRYILAPGQATSYMIGRLEILRMRAEAEQRQGAVFDVRKFHSAVLDRGSLPLGVLDQVVRDRLR